ncbi:type II and III secretion system protein family protein [Desulfovibrio mangrovi]|uniref:type II and III secretion system protein family protein n=1 Tax=Desulfovibrio mangrovi TaxID=2976983 RepID=UPI002246C77E|nr:type II and III secretion system protein family protein [Desulfovibrio mangrovi]UZP65902.1 type II and III secretion system protein family protein [Desulfovibrio mangrovi]
MHTTIAVIAAVLLCVASAALAAGPAQITPQTLEIVKGKSEVVSLTIPASRVSIADPDTADIVLLSPWQVYVTAKKPGVTSLTLWSRTGELAGVYDIHVTADLAQLKEMLHRLLPKETDIRVMGTGDKITLSGTVTSAASLATALEIAENYAPEKVTNLLSVGGVHQIMLEVKIAEMHRTVLDRFGIDLAYAFKGDFAYSMLNNLFYLDPTKGAFSMGESAAIVNPARNGMFRMTSGQVTLTGFLDVLKQNGLVRVLAEPTLICRSGEDAQFLVGGEIPIPIPQGFGTIAIEYKQYGVQLVFSPTVVSGDRISLKVFPEVSELDYSNLIEISGMKIPALSSRRASTVVELGNGQSFAIAGLMHNQIRENMKKYPGLGEVPILGTLFRSSEFRKEETELIIIVTPHLTKPLDVAQQKLPTDNFVEPTEMEFFFHGKMEGDRPANSGRIKPVSTGSPEDDNQPSTGMEGDFGHIIPQ